MKRLVSPLSLLKKLSPVRNCARHIANVYKIELVLREGPLLVDIVNFEPAIQGHKVRLNRREIDTNNFGRGMQIGHITMHVSMRDLPFDLWSGVT